LQRIDFEGLRADACAPRVFICATNVRTGLRRVLHNAELSVDVLLASACLPQVYQAVQIGDDFYWFGGYTGNPALAPLYLGAVIGYGDAVSVACRVFQNVLWSGERCISGE
jgi:NTE family protein